MYHFNCSTCRPDCHGNCPCDYGFACPAMPSMGEEEEEDPPPPSSFLDC